jgi:ribosomal protein S12 methylthiotransferase accessory factor
LYIVAYMTGAHFAKGYTRGTHRSVSPRETLERMKPYLSPMGITRVANVTGLDTIGIPVVMACRPNARSLAVSQGKGLDLDAARASAVMESVEGYHSENVELPLKLASYRDLCVHHTVVDTDLLPRFQWNTSFHPHLPLLWVEGQDWLQHESVWVPFQLVHGQYTAALRFDLRSFAVTSTGLASGNHLLEATSHAISELVERDAAHRFSLLPEAEREARRVDLDTVDDTDCRDALERFQRAGVAVAVWQLPSRVPLPGFECLIANRDDDPLWPQLPASGFGCHPVRHIALLRALTEAAQSRLTAISGARDDMPRTEYAAIRDAENLSLMRSRACAKGVRPFSAAPSHEHETFQEDLDLELALLEAAGYQRVILVDLALPGFDVSVVRVIVPGMEVRDASAASRIPEVFP